MYDREGGPSLVAFEVFCPRTADRAQGLADPSWTRRVD